MDKDKSQTNHLLHHEKNHEEVNVSMSGSVAERESSDKEADLDALEARLFAMVKSRL